MADYATVAEVKARIGKENADTDTVFTALITNASAAIDRFCNRPDGFVAAAVASNRLFAGSGKGYQAIDECAVVTAVAVKESVTASSYTAWATTDYILARGDPESPDFNRTPYNLLLVSPCGSQVRFTHGQRTGLVGFHPDPDDGPANRWSVPTVQVTARWGYALTVPGPIKEACIVQVARWFKRGQSSWADAISNGDFGALLYRKSLDPEVEWMLVDGRFKRPARP